jgi:hypothetical protein
MREVITLAGLDIARERDFAAIAVGQVIELDKNILRLKGAKMFPHQAYNLLEGEIARTVNKNHITKIFVDSTNEKSFAERLQRIGISVDPLHFTAPLKHDMVSYTLMIRSEDRLDIPVDGPFITELRSQIAEQERLLTTATIRYDHPEGHHDDLLWALCLLCYGAKPWLEGLMDYKIYRVGNTM